MFLHRIVIFLTPHNLKRHLFAFFLHVFLIFFFTENDLSFFADRLETYLVAFPVLDLISLAMIQYGREKVEKIFDIFIQFAFASGFTIFDVHPNFRQEVKFISTL
jgi:hypothetical protein